MNRLYAFALISAILFSGAAYPPASAAESVSFLERMDEEDRMCFPEPIPVAAVDRVEEIPHTDPDAGPQGCAENKAVRVSLIDCRFEKSILGKESPEGRVFLVVQTRWENIHPKERVEKSKLEGKVDRTMGAGAFAGGGSSSRESEYVEVDVEYRVPRAADHLYGLADGLAVSLHGRSVDLPGGVSPSEGFSIPEHGQIRDIGMAFLVPEEASDVALQFFDYSYGSIILPIRGDKERARDPERLLEAALDRADTPLLEIAASDLEIRTTYAKEPAPQGRRWAVVGLAGRSKSQSQKGKSDIVQLDPVENIWFITDGGYFHYAEAGSTDENGMIRFAPEVYQQQEAAVLVPEGTERLRLGVRIRNDVVGLCLTKAEPEGPPSPLKSYVDGKTMEVLFFGQRTDGDLHILDLGVRPLAKGRGLEIQPTRQFFVVTEDGEKKIEAAATRELEHGLSEDFVVPPDTCVRFEAAFRAERQAAGLRVRGFSSEGILALTADFEDELLVSEDQGGGKAPVEKHTGQDEAEKEAGYIEEPPKPGIGRKDDRVEKPAARPLVIESTDFDAPSVPEISVESGLTNREEAYLLEEPWTVRGRIDGGETHFFRLPVENRAQLWHLEAAGKTLSYLRYEDPGGGWEQQRKADRKTGEAVLTGLFLSPGSHYFALRSKRSETAEYTFRAVPLGPPDPHAEREPNDDITRAHRAAPDFPRTGYLYESEDVDCYRFSLTAPEILHIKVVPPDDLSVRMELSEVYTGGRTNPIAKGSSLEPGDGLVYKALLPAGDYLVELKGDSSDQRSDHPYTLALERLNPFEPPADLEPNDRPEQARPLPRDFILAGTVGRFEGEDWFEIPVVDRESNLSIAVEEEPERLGLSLHEDGSTRAARLLEWDDQAEVHRAVLPPETAFHLKVRGKGAYRMSVSFDPGPTPFSGETALPVGLAVEALSTEAAAYWPESQRIEAAVQITNHSDERLKLEFDAVSSNLDWRPDFPEADVEIGAGETRKIPMAVNIAADVRGDDPVVITVRARDQEGAQKTAVHHLVARCGASPQDPSQHRPLPPELLGGLNAAWTALGAQPVGADDKETKKMLPLLDGYTPLDGGWYHTARELPLELTVRLAGEKPVPVAGVGLHPLAKSVKPSHQLKEFDVLVSRDGEEFQTVFSGELDRRPVEQAFVFDRPVEARYARLRLRSNHEGASTGRVGMGQWKVIAAPGESVAPERPFNIGAQKLGGHVVWADPSPGNYNILSGMLTEEGNEKGLIRLPKAQPVHWVVAFHQHRAALIHELQWVDPPDGTKGNRLENIKVAVSTESPIGPWKELGRWRLERSAEGVKPFTLPEPVWARYVLFSSTDADERGYWQYPQTLRVIEHPIDERYRSILAEWGHYRREAVYETLEPGPQETFGLGPDEHGDRDNAHTLVEAEAFSSSVQIGEKEDWYRIDIPSDHNLLTLRLAGRPTLRCRAVLENEEGAVVSIDESAVSPREILMRAEVDPGASYYLRVHEPPRSVVFAWDNSSSMGPYRATVYQALQHFVEDIRPGLEYANFLPFQRGVPKLLHPEWSDQSYPLSVTLTNYHRQDGSSAARENLLAATEALEDRPGEKAIMLLTDAQCGTYLSEKLWPVLSKVRPRIFTGELHSGRDPRYHQQLMQSWASVNAGHYSRFRTQADVDQLFERASCYLRRPALYSVTASTRFEEPPEPDMYDTLIQDGRVVTHGIFFDIDSARLRSESYPVLRQIGEMLQEHPELRLTIEGHTDNTGSASWNQTLSERRAASVRDFLIERYEVEESRLESVGYGEERPADTNETEEGRQNNRRVELVKMDP
ncbi:MAG: OmpA family protein [Desulfobacteraceae bacterium]